MLNTRTDCFQSVRKEHFLKIWTSQEGLRTFFLFLSLFFFLVEIPWSLSPDLLLTTGSCLSLIARFLFVFVFILCSTPMLETFTKKTQSLTHGKSSFIGFWLASVGRCLAGKHSLHQLLKDKCWWALEGQALVTVWTASVARFWLASVNRHL